MKKLLKRIFNFLKSPIFLFFVGLMLFPTLTLIISAVIGFVYLVVYLKTSKGNRNLKRLMTIYSVNIFGGKGKGKDLLLQTNIILNYKRKWNRIYKKYLKSEIKNNTSKMSLEILKENAETLTAIYFEKQPNYIANIDYGYGSKILGIDSLNVAPNNYHSMINQVVEYIKKDDSLEGLDYFHSDTGIQLPSFADSELSKKYPSFPIAYALSRQLWNMNIHFNSQSLNRVWLKLREQQDAYIKALHTYPANKSFLQKIWKHIPILKNYLFVKWRYYELYESANAGLLPFNAKNRIGEITKGVAMSAGTATKAQYESMHGMIRDYLSVVKINDIKYDTRYYHRVFFGYEFKENDLKESNSLTKDVIDIIVEWVKGDSNVSE